MKNFIFIGSSHVIALIDAAKRLGATGEVVEVSEESDFVWSKMVFREYDFVLEDRQSRLIFILVGGAAPGGFLCAGPGGSVSIDPGFLKVCQAAKDKCGGNVTQVVSYVNGNEPSIFAIAEHPTPFDCFIDKDDPGLPEQTPPRQIIPADIVKRHVFDNIGEPVKYLSIVRRIFFTESMVHILPPPPLADETYMKNSPDSFASVFETYGIAPKPLRLKIYRLYCDTVAEQLATIGVKTIGVPEGVTHDGFLDTAYCKGATHGNHLYGHLLLQQLGAI